MDKGSPGCLAYSCGGSLFNSYSKLMQTALLAALPPPVVVSYSILIHIWWKMLFWLPCLLLWWFLIQFLFRFDAKCSSGCLASPCGGSLFNSYSKLIQTAPLAAFPLPVVVSHSILIQNWWNLSLAPPSSSSTTHVLFNSHSKLMNILSWQRLASHLRSNGFPLFYNGSH